MNIYDIWMYIFVFWNEKLICISRIYMVCNLYLENDFVPFVDKL